jgi:Methyltransferase domain
MARYDEHFFTSDHAVGGRRSAETVVPIVLDVTRASSVIDIGCGNGGWLKAYAEAGVDDFQGIDGAWVDTEWLDIPANNFSASDLSQPLKQDRRYDLATCLEVAEHLPPESAETIVDTLTGLADVVLFSAAVPDQGGTDHLNEQWPEYWVEMFAAKGFVGVDHLRPLLWDNTDVAWYYRQNLILFVAEAKLPQLAALAATHAATGGRVPALVHPDIWTRRNRRLVNLPRLIGRDRSERFAEVFHRVRQRVGAAR